MTSEDNLDTLVFWATSKGYHVEFTKGVDSCICHITKIIEINASVSMDNQVIHLLHECGHALIFDNGSVFNFKGKKNYDLETQNDGDRIYTVIEEAEAWRRGRELAKRLKIEVDEDVWEGSMIDALKEYINWASGKKRKKCKQK